MDGFPTDGKHRFSLNDLNIHNCSDQKIEKIIETIVLVCFSTDELPYFQCFFLDEDEAQFPFYAFSPLHI